ncbi:spore coat protein, partial [Mesobacillus zeae]
MQNYYTQNMANMTPIHPSQQMPVSPQLPPKPDNIFPQIKQEVKHEQKPAAVEAESSSMAHIYQGGFQQSMIPHPYNYCPVSPAAQGSGYPYHGGAPMMPYQHAPYGPVGGQQMPAAQLPIHHSEMESSSFVQMPNMPSSMNMPNMPNMAGMANMPNMA